MLPITDQHFSYTEEVYEKLLSAGIRVEKDLRNEKIGFKIREAQISKIPYMLVLGDQEAQSAKIAVRRRRSQETQTMDIEAFLSQLKSEIDEKTIDVT